MFRTKRPPTQSPSARSDRALATGIGQGKTAALGQLYDRYGPAIYSLMRQKHPASAEPIVEQVFAAVWNMGRHGRLPLPIGPVLLDLATRSLAETTVPPVLPTSEAALQDALALLARIGHSDPLVCNALVLVCLGRSNLAESAMALEVEPAVVGRALTSGLALLRQLQPVAGAEACDVRQVPAPSSLLAAVQAVPENGAQSSLPQPAHL